jgi:predicted PolB exonuclease-like 3'-5' exonuclease
MLCIFDIETIPDIELIKKHYKIQSDGKDACNEAFEIQKEKTGSSFLPIQFHKSIVISAVIADEYGNFQKVNSIIKDSENEILKTFLGFIDRHNPKLVTFNGRGFDIPMIMLRAMKYNIACPAYFDQNNILLNKTKWENYRARYSDKFHIDLMDSMSEFGAVRGLNLDTLCMMSNLPGKFDIHGGDVTSLYFDDKIDDIAQYCESDALNTYWLYLKYQILNGNLLLSDYHKVLSHFLEKLPKDKNYSEIFEEYILAELDLLDSEY